MSRRRRDPDEPKPFSFEAPDFDEDEFIFKETISFRTTFILFLYSVITAAASFGIWLLIADAPRRGWIIALLIGAALGYLLRYIYPLLKVDISHFGRKEWTGTGFLYFFSWLAFFIFFTNPPVYDGVAPEVEIFILPDGQEPGGSVLISVATSDNQGIDTASFRLEVLDPQGTNLATAETVTHLEYADAWHWSGTFDHGQVGIYTVTAQVKDVKGLTTKVEKTFEVGDVLKVSISGGGRLETKLDAITVEVPETMDVWRVLLERMDLVQGEPDTSPNDATDNETKFRGPEFGLAHDRIGIIELAYDDTTGVWFANAGHIGFYRHYNETQNLTFTFRVVVIEHDTYIAPSGFGPDGERGYLTSSRTYMVEIDSADLLTGDQDPAPKKPRDLSRQQTPGPGFAALLGTALIGAVLLARRRSGNE